VDIKQQKNKGGVMRKKNRFFVFLLFCLVMILFPGPAAAIWIGIDNPHIFPEHPTDLDSVTVFISGEISTPCDSIWYEYHQIQGNRINLHLQFYEHQGFCPDVIDPFYLQIPIGRLPAGLCTLYVIVDSYPYFWGMIFEVTEHTGDPTDVSDSQEDMVDKFVLSQNYPNPFNSATGINYVLPEDAWVTLFIYNGVGQKVKTLENRMRSKGSYSVTWNGTDDNGKEVASGIYFYQLRAGNLTKTKKLVLIK